MARYARLRTELDIAGINKNDLSGKLSIGERTLTGRFLCEHPWTIDEMYAILDLLRWPYNQMNTLFPRDGIDIGTANGNAPIGGADGRIGAACPKCGNAYRILFIGPGDIKETRETSEASCPWCKASIGTITSSQSFMIAKL